MNGSGNGNTITLLPLSGFGEFQGSLHNHSLDLSMVNMSGPGAIQCSVTSRGQWKTIAAHTKGFTSRQLSTPEFLAMDDLIIAGSLTEGISSGADGPFANQVALANALSAQQGRFINPNARDGYTVGAAPRSLSSASRPDLSRVETTSSVHHPWRLPTLIRLKGCRWVVLVRRVGKCQPFDGAWCGRVDVLRWESCRRSGQIRGSVVTHKSHRAVRFIVSRPLPGSPADAGGRTALPPPTQVVSP